jgi:hypothetical protein
MQARRQKNRKNSKNKTQRLSTQIWYLPKKKNPSNEDVLKVQTEIRESRKVTEGLAAWLNGREPTQQAQGPEFKPQPCKKKKKRRDTKAPRH